jgi:hypothetical protein
MDRDYYKNSGLEKSPPVRLLTIKETNKMLNDWHYLGKVKGVLYSYGHEEGCCVFTNCRSRMFEQKNKRKNINVIELTRMVGKNKHKWSMSSLMSQCEKELKKLNKYDLIVTYSDPFAGHNGMTYKSANWIFDGFSTKEKVYLIDGKRIARRTLYDRHGTQSIPKMKEIYGNRLEIKESGKKKRFIKILNKNYGRENNEKQTRL